MSCDVHIPAQTMRQMMAALRPGGTVRVYGVLSGDTTTVGTIDMRASDKTLGGFILPAWIKRQVNVAPAPLGTRRLSPA